MCDNCGDAIISIGCTHCHDFNFCGQECADFMAKEHHAVCYDTMNDDDAEHLQILLSICGIQLITTQYDDDDGGEDAFIIAAHEHIEDFLVENDFPQEALEYIDLNFSKRRKRVKKVKPVKVKKVKRVRKQRPIKQKKERVQQKRKGKVARFLSKKKKSAQRVVDHVKNVVEKRRAHNTGIVPPTVPNYTPAPVPHNIQPDA